MGSITNSTWQTVQIFDVVASDFTQSQGVYPNFAASGEPIQFGCRRSIVNGGSDPNTWTHGIDHFTVTIRKSDGSSRIIRGE